MKVKTLIGLAASGQLPLLAALRGTFQNAYRAAFVTAGISEGLFNLLRAGPASLDQIHAHMVGRNAAAYSLEKLRAWLEVGVTLGELKSTPAGYTLRGRLARQFARESNDALAAMFLEVFTLHHDLLLQTPARLRSGEFLALGDTDGQLIARSSRILEPYILDVVDDATPPAGPLSVLEVGCGSGVYVRQICRRNPQARVVGLELQPEVAAFARRNLQSWGLADRTQVETADVRAFAPAERFDLVTLHNNIYYFPVAERLDLLRRLSGFLKPGGRLLVTTGCAGYPATMLLNLWGEMTAGAGPLPEAREFTGVMRQAGFNPVRAAELLPGGGFYAFTGVKA